MRIVDIMLNSEEKNRKKKMKLISKVLILLMISTGLMGACPFEHLLKLEKPKPRITELLGDIIIPLGIDVAIPDDFVVMKNSILKEDPWVYWGKEVELMKYFKDRYSISEPIFSIKPSANVAQIGPNKFSDDNDPYYKERGIQFRYLNWGPYPVREIITEMEGTQLHIAHVGTNYEGWTLLVNMILPKGAKETPEVWKRFINETSPLKEQKLLKAYGLDLQDGFSIKEVANKKLIATAEERAQDGTVQVTLSSCDPTTTFEVNDLGIDVKRWKEEEPLVKINTTITIKEDNNTIVDSAEILILIKKVAEFSISTEKLKEYEGVFIKELPKSQEYDEKKHYGGSDQSPFKHLLKPQDTKTRVIGLIDKRIPSGVEFAIPENFIVTKKNENDEVIFWGPKEVLNKFFNNESLSEPIFSVIPPMNLGLSASNIFSESDEFIREMGMQTRLLNWGRYPVRESIFEMEGTLQHIAHIGGNKEEEVALICMILPEGVKETPDVWKRFINETHPLTELETFKVLKLDSEEGYSILEVERKFLIATAEERNKDGKLQISFSSCDPSIFFEIKEIRNELIKLRCWNGGKPGIKIKAVISVKEDGVTKHIEEKKLFVVVKKVDEFSISTEKLKEYEGVFVKEIQKSKCENIINEV